jgi:pilus assembly protein CpaE
MSNMNARTHSLTERVITDYFVFASLADEHVQWLANTLVAAGVIEQVTLDPSMLTQRIAALNPSLVLVDFSGGRAAAASAATSAARAAYPGSPSLKVHSLRYASACAISSIYRRRRKTRCVSLVRSSTTWSSRSAGTVV